MKKTLNINLAGYPFTIDEDAYKLLKDYLDTIRYAYDTGDDTGELASDIESRIAELLLEKEAGGIRIVTFEEISNVIERIGNPSDFIEIDETFEKKPNINEHEEIRIDEKITPPPYDSVKKSKNPFVRKRLFRDPQNSMLGGVCSGLAAYLNIDVTIVRLLTVLLFFLSATTVAIVYIILWIVVPEAGTPIQRMQMMGQDPTVENIGKTVTESFHESNESQNSENRKEKKGFFPTAFSIFVKCCIIIGLIIAFPLIIALALGFVGCIIAVFVLGVIIAGGSSAGLFTMFNTASEEILAFYILLAVIGGIITVAVPLWLFIRSVWRKKDANPNAANRRAILIVWLCGIALLSVFTVKAVKKSNQLDRSNWNLNIENLNNHLEDAEIENLNIDNNGIHLKINTGKNKDKEREEIQVEINDSTVSVLSQPSEISVAKENIEATDTIVAESIN